jgi:hypothetical protein
MHVRSGGAGEIIDVHAFLIMIIRNNAHGSSQQSSCLGRKVQEDQRLWRRSGRLFDRIASGPRA